MPRIAPTLYDFVEADNGEYLKVAEAVFRIFDRQDWLRVNRARARIKVFVDKFGIDELRKQVEEELKGDWVAERDFDSRALRFDIDEEADAPAARRRLRLAQRRPVASSSASAVQRPPAAPGGLLDRPGQGHRGDLTPEQFRGLAEIMRDYSGGYARTTVSQNLVLRWVRDEAVYDVWQRARASSTSATPARDEITDVVSCPGTD